jgi:RNase adapter protein RapZ
MNPAADSPLELVIVTGLSGAGKTTAVAALEDLGYFCVDNLPIPVLGSTLDALEKGGERRVAFGLDARGGSYLLGTPQALGELSARPNLHLRILFLDSSDELIIRRFSQTRRPHPLTKGDRASVTSVAEAVVLEREILTPLRDRASLIVDTTEMSVHELRRTCFDHFAQADVSGSGALRVRIMSFGFKYGLPNDADLVLDVRFLPNPYFVDELRSLSGHDEAVRDYVLRGTDSRTFLELTEALIRFCLPLFRREGKSYLTIAIGCTGGRHRSVALVETLASELAGEVGTRLETRHRDVHRAGGNSPGSLDSVGQRPSEIPPSVVR